MRSVWVWLVLSLSITDSVTAAPKPRTPPQLQSSVVAAVDERALVIDSDSGFLVLADERGEPIASLAIGSGAGTLAYDPEEARAYVADRTSDQIIVVSVRSGLDVVERFPTPAEPYGVALSLDRRTLLVTSITDRVLVAFDPRTGVERWRVPVGIEPRGVAISPDGAHAMVSHLTTGAVERVTLAKHTTETIALLPKAALQDHARNVYSTAYVATDAAFVPFMRSVPEAAAPPRATAYYGDGVAVGGTMITANKQSAPIRPLRTPTRAVAYDDESDNLYLAGDDALVQIHAPLHVPAISGSLKGVTFAGLSREEHRQVEHCGAEGVAITANRFAWVWCGYTRRLAHVEIGKNLVKHGSELTATHWTPEQHRGMELYSAQPLRGAACSSCHPEGRNDGLVWKVSGAPLKTPALAGRLDGTAPYKWDGSDATLAASITTSIARLNGTPLSPDDTSSIVAYLQAMPPIRKPAREAKSVARGKNVFDATGCADCHDGPSYTDRLKRQLEGSDLDADTPSLVGIGANAPYFHDGSAPTLDVLLRDHGTTIHGMVGRRLTDREVTDLTAFLETL